MPAATTRSRSTSADESTSSTSSAAMSSAADAWPSTSSSVDRSASTREERSASATRTWLWPKSTPSTDPGRRVPAAAAPAAGRAPACAVSPTSTTSAPGLQVGDDGGHGRPREAREPGELAAARRAVAPKLVDDAQPVQLSERPSEPTSLTARSWRSNRALSRLRRKSAGNHPYIRLSIGEKS